MLKPTPNPVQNQPTSKQILTDQKPNDKRLNKQSSKMSKSNKREHQQKINQNKSKSNAKIEEDQLVKLKEKDCKKINKNSIEKSSKPLERNGGSKKMLRQRQSNSKSTSKDNAARSSDLRFSQNSPRKNLKFDKDSMRESRITRQTNRVQVADLKIELQKLIKNYSKSGRQDQLTAEQFKQLSNDLYLSLGTNTPLNAKQLNTVTIAFDSSEDGIIQIEQLESIIRDQGLNQKKKKTQQLQRKGDDTRSQESSLFSMF